MMLARCLRCKAPRGLLRVAGLSSSVQQKGRREATTDTQHLTAAAEPPQTHTAAAEPPQTHTAPAEPPQTHTAAAEPPQTHTAPAEPTQTHTARGFDVGLLVSVLRQENASDICVIRVSPELRYTDHMIIVSGSSPRHLSAMAEFVLKAFKSLRKNEERHVRLEGRDCDDWKCIDFGSMVLHLMLSDTRDTYELEKLWTLRSHDEQLQRIPQHTLPSDFILDMQNN